MSPTAKPMSFSIGLSPYDRWDGIGSIAKAALLAEELGYFGVLFPEHIIMTVRPDSPRFMTLWYDNFVLATHLATLTKRVRLNFNVMVVNYRPPGRPSVAGDRGCSEVQAGEAVLVGCGGRGRESRAENRCPFRATGFRQPPFEA